MQLDPSVPVTKVRTLESVITSSTAAPRSLTMLLTAFGALAILVGAIGVYSLISYTVSWRTREIGLRLALGANRLQIARLVLGQSLALAVAGSVLGIAGAVAATRLMSRFLFETSPLDPLTYALVILFCALLPWAPALAPPLDPMIAAQRVIGRSRRPPRRHRNRAQMISRENEPLRPAQRLKSGSQFACLFSGQQPLRRLSECRNGARPDRASGTPLDLPLHRQRSRRFARSCSPSPWTAGGAANQSGGNRSLIDPRTFNTRTSF
jgi:hypothetical protein